MTVSNEEQAHSASLDDRTLISPVRPKGPKFMKDESKSPNTTLPPALSTIVQGGLVAGILDACAGVIVYYIYFGFNPIEVLQFIASGVWGPKAIGGGLLMVLAGTFFHFLIAFVAAAVYYAAATIIKPLYTHPVLMGLIFGAGVWSVMNLIVLPASNIPKAPFDLGLAVIGIVWHMILVGLPIAWFTADKIVLFPTNNNQVTTNA